MDGNDDEIVFLPLDGEEPIEFEMEPGILSDDNEIVEAIMDNEPDPHELRSGFAQVESEGVDYPVPGEGVTYTQASDGEMTPIMADDALLKEAEEAVDKVHLTEKEKQVLYAIRIIQHDMGYSPTCPELAEMFNVSASRTKQIVLHLVEKGMLEWSTHKSWVHKRILFPRGVTFPWEDRKQFPSDVFPKTRNPIT